MMIQKDKFFQNKGIVLLLALLCSFLWGSAFPTIKIGYSAFAVQGTGSTLLFAGVRFTLAGILVLLFGSFLQRRVLFPKKSSWGKVGLLSLAQTGVQYLFFYIGLSNCSGVKSSLLFTINVFFSIQVACFLFRQERFTLMKAVGCLIGFFGVLVINFDGLDASFSLFGEGFILLAAFSSAVSSSLIKLFSKDEDPVALCAYQFVCGGALLALVGWALGGTLTVWTGKGVLILIYLALVSSVAYTLWGVLLQYNKPSTIALFGFLNPAFGMILSAWWLNEEANVLLCLIALSFIALGIWIVNRYGERPLFGKNGE